MAVYVQVLAVQIIIYLKKICKWIDFFLCALPVDIYYETMLLQSYNSMTKDGDTVAAWCL